MWQAIFVSQAGGGFELYGVWTQAKPHESGQLLVVHGPSRLSVQQSLFEP